MGTITLCTAPKPFTDPLIARIQVNALRSWRALEPEVEAVVIGEEAGAEEAARQTGCRYVASVERNAQGTPLIRSIFDQARAVSASPILAYANADIILLDDFVEAVGRVAAQMRLFLLAARRWDLRIEGELRPGPGWEAHLREAIRSDGRRHPPAGSDLFVFPRDCYIDIPALTVGRAGWDNWMIYEARRRRWPVVDMSEAITVVHQDHDYRHLPGGRPHYRLPETDENVRLAGGRRAILSLTDADYVWRRGKARRKPVTVASLVRGIELFPLLRLESAPLANLAYAVVHPRRAFHEFRGWLSWKVGQVRRSENHS